MSEQNETQAIGLPRPITNDSQAWKAYWKQTYQPWRTQQEILSEPRPAQPPYQKDRKKES
jgi:hypothetical protein